MKKLIFLFLLLFLLPLFSAVEFNMNEEFSQGETLMAKVSGNFILPLQEENVFFYRAHVKIPLEYGIKKIEGDYYIYALLSGKEPGDYSIALENIKYMKGAEMSEEDIIKNFTITSQTADFSVNPGFASESQFSMQVQNLQDSQITIEIKTADSVNASGEAYQEPIILKSGQKKNIDFSFEFPEPTFKIIKLNTENLEYEIPTIIPATEMEEGVLKFEPDSLILSAPTSEKTSRVLFLYNTKTEDVADVTISLSNSLKNYVNLSVTEMEKIDANSNVLIELTFFSEEEFELEGHVKAKQGEDIIYASVSAKFLKGYVPSEMPVQNYTTKTCAELGYVICKPSEVCSSGNTVYAKNDVCCIGTCEAPKKSQIGKIIGITILILILVIGIWFYRKKYRKAKKPVNLLDIAKGKKQDFSPPLERTKKKLTYNPETRTIANSPPRVIEKPVTKIVEKPVIQKVFVEKPQPPTAKYVGSSNTKKYHKSSCRLSKLIKDEYKESTDDVTEFQRKGYRPCKVCFKF